MDATQASIVLTSNLGPSDLANSATAHGSDTHNPNIADVPPSDRGKDAFVFLAACFFLEALIWGFPLAFGVFQNYFDTHEPFASQNGSTIIGTTTFGTMYIASPIVAIAIRMRPRLRRKASYCGIAIVVLALVSASFCDSIKMLVLTQGALYGFGAILIYFPVLGLIPDWFVRRRGLAYGIMWAGTGLAGAIFPFVLQWLLDSFGHRTALRVIAVTVAIGTTPCIYLIKPRVAQAPRGQFRLAGITFVAHIQFWIFLAGNILQSLGFFLPTIYIPEFASSVGLPTFAGPLALALVNLAFCFGAILIGSLVDRFHVTVAIAVCTIGQLLAIFVFWGLTTSQPMFYMFAVLFGCFGAAYPCTWPGYGKAIQKFDHNGQVDIGILVALMNAGKGIGAIVSGPLSQKLLHLNQRKEHADFTYGSEYGSVLVFTGISAGLGGVAIIAKVFDLV